MKFCKDCEWYLKAFSGQPEIAYCAHPTIGSYAVDGKLHIIYCSDNRKDSGMCKPEGVLFDKRVTFIDKVKGWFGK